MAQEVKVLLYRREEATYTRFLADALSKKGVRVLRRFWPMPIHFLGRRRIWHIHWPEFYYKLRPTLFRTLLSLLAWAYFILVAIPSAAMLRIPIIYTLHNLLPHEEYLRFMDRIAMRKVLAHSGVVIAHCQRAKAEFRAEFPGYKRRIEVIAHGPLQDPSGLRISKAEARRRLKIPADKYVYLHIGKLRVYKGLEELIPTFKRACGSEDILLIAGKPINNEYAQKLLHLAREDRRIRLHLGYLTDEELALHLTACDCIVMPYRRVTTSGVALLALTFQKPAVAPDEGCLTEQLGGVGVYYESRDARTLAEAMIKVKETDRSHIAVEARRKLGEVSWNEIAERIRAIYLYTLEER